MQSSKDKEAHARELLRPYVEKPEFRQYLREQILEWEQWYRSQVVEIEWHEKSRDQYKEKLDHGISQGTVDPEDPDDVWALSYEWHKYEASAIPRSSEFRLIAEGEPICFQAASMAAMVALFWCDINHSNLLAPEYSKLPDFDFFAPDRPFLIYLFEQRENPIQGRYVHIDWIVQAAIDAYKQKDVGANTPESELMEKQFREAIGIYKANQWKTGCENTRKTMHKVQAGKQAGWIFGSGTKAIGFANSHGKPLVAKKNEKGEWQTLMAASLNEKTFAFFKQFPPGKFKMPASRLRDSDT